LALDQDRTGAWVIQVLSELRSGAAVFGVHHLEQCPVCGLVYERNPGDTWAFTIFGDRLPVAAVIVLLYFGFVQVHRVLGFALIVAVLLLLVWTSPNRWGAGIALHYLSRICWLDPADPVPAKRGDDLS
jgi:hypothetical protein